MAQFGLGQEQVEEDFHPDFKEYMERELKYSRLHGKSDKEPDYYWEGIRWVFWNRQDDHLTLCSDHSVDSSPDVCASRKVRLNIRHALHKLILPPQLNHSLVQFWAPTKTPEGRILLTAQTQPFALGRDYRMQMTSSLCEYRMRMCREYNSFYADAESEEEQLGLPGRVFLNQLPESTPGVKYYSPKEYPQRDLALHFKISGSWALPVFEHSSHTCVGVLEISSRFSESNRRWWDEEFLGHMYDIFQGFGLRCFDGYKHCNIQYEDENKAAFQELNMVYQSVCNIRDLPLALTWVSCRSCNNLLPSHFQFPVPVHRDGEYYDNLFSKFDYFLKVGKVCHLRKGQVTGRILQRPNLLYCSDVKQFSIAEFPLVPYARYCELGGWFTMCLKSNSTGDELYVLEFFLPTSNKNDENILTRLRLILDTMDVYFNTFKLASGQGLGEALSVEVIDFQNGQRSRSNQMIPATGCIPGLELLQDGGVMLQQGQQDHPSMDAINNGISVASEAQNNFPSLDSLKNMAECGLGQEEEEYFLPDFKEYMERELKYSRLETSDKPPPGFESDLPKHIWEGIGWVFWNRQDDDDNLSLSYDHSVNSIPDVCASPKVRQNIRHALHKFILHRELSNSLVQFWAPTKTPEGRTLLVTEFQPFALGMTHIKLRRNWLLGYRMGMCREYNNCFYADAESGEQQLGLPGRVFLNKLPESTPKVKHYTLEEYPQHDFALRCYIEDSWGLPVFERSSHTCVGVLEIVSLDAQLWHDEEFQGRLYDIFQEFGLLCFDGYKHCKMQYGDTNEALKSAFQELKMAYESVCKIYSLPLALTWVSCRPCSNLLQSQFQFSVRDTCDSWEIYFFMEVSKVCHLRKGQVTRRILPFPNLLYCSDVKEFSIAESPLVPYARFCKLGGWFTVCLQSSYTGDEIYMLEFFLPASNKNDEIILTRLSLILKTMDIYFKTFKLATGQGLGEALSVEVINFQFGQRRHSIQMIPANRFSPSLELLQDGGVMLQRGQQGPPSMDAINNGMYVTSESQKYNLPSLDSLPNGKVRTQLDSFDQSSMDPSSNGQSVVTVEGNIPVVSSSKEGKRKMQDRKDQKGGPRIDIPKEEILKCSHMYRKDAAAALNVGISTFKRVCRDHGILRWPPRSIEKNQPFLPIENQGQTPQSNSDLPSNEASSSVANIKTGFEDADMVTIRAKCEKYTIKFCLSLPPRLVDLQQEVAKRRKLMAESYDITYKDEKDELILITCDEDLQDCIQFFRSLGNNDIYITLE